MNDDYLAQYGFEEYFNRTFAPEYSTRSFQKKVVNVLGDTLYYVNLHYYPAVDAWSAECRFAHHGRPCGEDTHISVQYVTNLRALGMHVHNLWRACGGIKYEQEREVEE